MMEMLHDLSKQDAKKRVLRHSCSRSASFGVEEPHMSMKVQDLINWLPIHNPMSTCEHSNPEEELALEPGSRTTREQLGRVDAHSRQENQSLQQEANEDLLVAPQVQVAEDGSLILNEQSISVGVQQSSSICVVEGSAVLERGNATTYSSFLNKTTHTRRWSDAGKGMAVFRALSLMDICRSNFTVFRYHSLSAVLLFSRP
uniref:Uncharacterized protein n=1 Tax=Eptatretus burgeri TaxID=7764 RepID=A0A8C4NCN4_EPTBU